MNHKINLSPSPPVFRQSNIRIFIRISSKFVSDFNIAIIDTVCTAERSRFLTTSGLSASSQAPRFKVTSADIVRDFVDLFQARKRGKKLIEVTESGRRLG